MLEGGNNQGSPSNALQYKSCALESNLMLSTAPAGFDYDESIPEASQNTITTQRRSSILVFSDSESEPAKPPVERVKRQKRAKAKEAVKNMVEQDEEAAKHLIQVLSRCLVTIKDLANAVPAVIRGEKVSACSVSPDSCLLLI